MKIIHFLVRLAQLPVLVRECQLLAEALLVCFLRRQLHLVGEFVLRLHLPVALPASSPAVLNSPNRSPRSTEHQDYGKRFNKRTLLEDGEQPIIFICY